MRVCGFMVLCGCVFECLSVCVCPLMHVCVCVCAVSLLLFLFRVSFCPDPFFRHFFFVVISFVRHLLFCHFPSFCCS